MVIGGYFALRSVTIQEAERDTRERVQVEGRLVETALTNGVLRGDAAALRQLDDLVQGQVLGESVVRVKLWTPDGTILYSDEPRLIGERFALGEEEAELFETGGADAELSDLSEPENRFERQEDKLLEAHTPIRTPDGTQVLFETYQRFSSVSASATRILRTLAPPLLAALFVLLLIQLPLAYGLARRLQRGHDERERLLARAIEASDTERRRIAGDLHDGVVQDLAGVAFGLAPIAAKATDEDARVLNASIERLRQGVRDLRTLLVEIHPPRLESAGLEAALDDLLSPLRAVRPADDARGRADPRRRARLPRGARGAAQRRRARERHPRHRHRHAAPARRSPTTAPASPPSGASSAARPATSASTCSRTSRARPARRWT